MGVRKELAQCFLGSSSFDRSASLLAFSNPPDAFLSAGTRKPRPSTESAPLVGGAWVPLNGFPAYPLNYPKGGAVIARAL